MTAPNPTPNRIFVTDVDATVADLCRHVEYLHRGGWSALAGVHVEALAAKLVCSDEDRVRIVAAVTACHESLVAGPRPVDTPDGAS
jgi:hypothetical protein